MVVGLMMLLFLVSSWMIIHFGRNPDRGGRPPNVSMDKKIKVDIRGILFHKSGSERVVVGE